MSFPARIRIVEVGPRDGLQNEATILPVETRIALVESLARAGIRDIEAGSFVSPAHVPQMAPTRALFAGLPPLFGTRLSALVPNMPGLEAAMAAGVRKVAVFAAASESFSRANINCSIAESLARFAPVVEKALKEGIGVRGYVSCALGCPYEGQVAPEKVAEVARDLAALGCTEISLGDTIGTGTPFQAKKLVESVARNVPIERLALHFHDTYGQALANLFACLELGVSTIDASVAGLGGCPYAPGAGGNVATEDVVYMLNGMGIPTGIDLSALMEAGEFICGQLGHPSRSRVSQAIAARRLKTPKAERP